MADQGPQFPLYIPSKGRSEYMITSKYLTYMGVRHNVVVEPSQMDDYRNAIKSMNLLATAVELDLSYKEKYELCDNHGLTKSTGPGPARNFAWDHSKSNGYDWHWVMDDNIRSFRRLNKNEKVKVINGSIFKAMEDFCLRYENISMAGPNYFMFASARSKTKPFITNTRIYSCNLIRNDVPFKWRGRYNEDTILSLDMLKNKWCTVQFNAFLQEKMPTQAVKGGNTGEFYHVEGTVKKGEKYADTGTLAKSQMQVSVHPDVSRLVHRFGRIHHYVDYGPFKNNELVRKKGVTISSKVDNYGMGLIESSNFKDSGETFSPDIGNGT
tara:strand:+ start:679 stop:1653 length:975 start_codon:yes stop_codon:yes gene_type:complete